ncbi:MAG: transcriptional repressor [Alphaproteobacteria bacterium]|nr:transcriptional repressor [Alphaproteobacteria bacterium]
MNALEVYCEENGLRLTEPRKVAYKIVQSMKKPITAYDVLEKMGKHIKNPKPPTAYRALDFLAEHGFIHRIESLNAYVSCEEGHRHHGSQFLICDKCARVEEIHLCSLPAALDKKMKEEHFKMTYWNIEIHGTCSKCSSR